MAPAIAPFLFLPNQQLSRPTPAFNANSKRRRFAPTDDDALDNVAVHRALSFTVGLL